MTFRTSFVVLALYSCNVTLRADVTRVGERGDPQRLIVEGAHAFRVDQIRAAIDKDLTVQVAAAPSAPMEKYLTVLGERVAAGYRNSGFPDARAVATVEGDDGPGRVVLRVTEGPGYHKGGVKVLVGAGPGAGTLAAEELAGRLASVPPEPFFATTFDSQKNLVSVGMAAPTDAELPDRATWERGAAVSFEPGPLEQVRKAVRRALAEMGFFRAAFDVRVERVKPDGGDADLVVDVTDPGPRAVLGTLEIVGLSRDAEAALRELCGLAEGRPLDLLALQAMQQKLWDSARFKKHLLAARPAGRDEPGKLTLRIDLEELAAAPPLGGPLSDVEQAMLRCRDYLANMAGGDDDMVIEARTATSSMDTVFGFARGWTMRGGLVPAPADAGAGESGSGGGKLEAGFAATPQAIAVHDLGAGARVSLRAPEPTLVVNATYAPAVDEKGRAEWVFNVGAGFKTQRRAEGQPPVRVKLRLAPVAFVDLAHDPKYGLRLREGVVESAAPGTRIRIDAATGRPLEVRVSTPDGSYAARAERGALARMAAGLEADTRESFDEAAPVGSVARFGLGLLCAYQSAVAPGVDTERSLRAAEAVRSLLTPEVTEPLERAFLARFPAGALAGKAGHGSGQRPVRFLIPPEFGAGPVSPQGFGALIALPYVNTLFPRGSWPWTVTREMLLVTGGRPSESAGEVSRVFASPDTGPLGFLVCAEILARADSKSAALFARRGLGRLAPEHFERDWRALLDDEKAAPQFLARVVRRLGELPPADVEALAAVLSPKQGAALRRVAEMSRAAGRAGGDPGALPRVLWDDGLRHYVEARLNALAGGDPAREKAPAPFSF